MHDDVGQPAEVASALADQVGQALAPAMHDSVVAVRGHVLGLDGLLEARRKPGRKRGLGDLELLEGDRTGAPRRTSSARWRSMNGPSSGLPS